MNYKKGSWIPYYGDTSEETRLPIEKDDTKHPVAAQHVQTNSAVANNSDKVEDRSDQDQGQVKTFMDAEGQRSGLQESQRSGLQERTGKQNPSYKPTQNGKAIPGLREIKEIPGNILKKFSSLGTHPDD